MMFGWLKRKSEELSRAHIAQALEGLIKIANRADANIHRTGGANPNDVRAVTKAKDRLMIDMCGPVPLEVVWKEIIQPMLDQMCLMARKWRLHMSTNTCKRGNYGSERNY